MLAAQSGSGKTELLKDVCASFANDSGRLDKRRVQMVSFPSGTTADALAGRIIRALRPDSWHQLRTSQVRDFSRELLVNEDIGVLLLDEANHITELRSKRSVQTKTNRDTADYLKECVELSRISIVIAGLTHSSRLLLDNEQLEGRALRPIELRPYRWFDEEERRHFSELCAAFLGRAGEMGWRIEMPMPLLMKALYLASGGLTGRVYRMLDRATLNSVKTKVLTFEVMAKAFSERLRELTAGNPFAMTEIKDETLNTAHRKVQELGEEPLHTRSDRSR
jgi:hypothetical protein